VVDALREMNTLGRIRILTNKAVSVIDKNRAGFKLD